MVKYKTAIYRINIVFQGNVIHEDKLTFLCDKHGKKLYCASTVKYAWKDFNTKYANFHAIK